MEEGRRQLSNKFCFCSLPFRGVEYPAVVPRYLTIGIQHPYQEQTIYLPLSLSPSLPLSLSPSLPLSHFVEDLSHINGNKMVMMHLMSSFSRRVLKTAFYDPPGSLFTKILTINLRLLYAEVPYP